MKLVEDRGVSNDAVLPLASRPLGGNKGRKFPRWPFWTLLAALATALSVLKWGGYILISNDPLTPHADGAVVLQGSFLGERARLAGAVQLLQQGVVDRILLSVPHESYWGQRVSPAVRSFIENAYGQDVADRTDFCEAGADVDSTQQEASEMGECVRQQYWHSFVVVTSDYHSRRAGIIWRRTLRQQHLSFRMSVHGVTDREFQPAGWWRDRRYAKTWFLESTKLLWTLISR